MKNPQSSQKIARAARRIYNKEMRKEAEELGRTIGNFLKPKPKWVPWWLWRKGLGIFIKIKRTK